MVSAVNEKTYYITGLSADEKPKLTAKSNGSVFYEMDTHKWFCYDGEHLEWKNVVKVDI